ncbi:protein kinase superfamily protein isoform X2 [Wolffia australiana]
MTNKEAAPIRDHAEQDESGKIAVVYRRRRQNEAESIQRCVSSNEPRARVSLALSKRISWNRDLSTRGRESIVIAPGADFRVPSKPSVAQRKNLKPPLAKRKSGKPNAPDFRKEKAYFEEVDAFELAEESPSPKQLGTWAMGVQKDQNNYFGLDLPAVLERWKISKLATNCRRSGHLFKIMETPLPPSVSTCSEVSCALTVENSEKIPESYKNLRKSLVGSLEGLRISDELQMIEEKEELEEEDLKKDERKSLAFQRVSVSGETKSSFEQLLMVCRQSTPFTLPEVISQYCNPDSLIKIGEGTYGEAFRAGSAVCKIVPIDGDQLVNGEIQKKSEEVIEEVLLSMTLNDLREKENEERENACNIFIETKELRVCHGNYGSALINAWEDWDAKHVSENDHPKDFSENQRYVVFVLADGGRDLESFVLFNFEEARSLLVQVTAGLAVAEIACEFEHRDLHWGNILLARRDEQFADFVLRGKKMRIKSSGLAVSIIDFTLSRIKTGEAILFLDLSSDPALFEGPKGDRQAETYRKMREVTEDSWEASFPQTNVLWLQYLVDMLLLKKTFERTTKDERDLRSFKKRLSSYDSAGDSLSDEFFIDLLEEL